MSLEIRSLTREDLPEAGAVYAASWRYSHAQVCSAAFVDAHTGEEMARRLEAEYQAGATVFLARVDGAAAGIAVIDPATREVRQLYVAPTLLGTGVAQALMERALALLGDGTVMLTVMSVNARARRFYEKCGFVCSGEERVLDEKTGLRELRYVRRQGRFTNG